MRVPDGGEHFRDPHWNKTLRELAAHDRRVIRAVGRTPGIRHPASGIRQILTATVAQAQSHARGPSAAQYSLHIAVGCAGRRHRPVDRTTGGHSGRERIPVRASTASTTGRWRRTAGSRPEPGRVVTPVRGVCGKRCVQGPPLW
ncbi:ATPase [Streptomyces sp. NPDC057557]|uniref:RapZ C-terminal domain-containing protein n=1 Tax=Streptomyces sp. NPDC057557 TaxID=3346167 RepID=UPI0036844948